MKKILFLLLLITSVSYGQAIAPTRVKITNNAISTTAPFVPVQETDGFINKINKSDLIEVLEYASAVNLPVTGVAGKIYVTLDNNRLYRWTGTIYQDLANTITPTNLDYLAKPDGGDLFSSTGNYATIPLAMDGNSGLMSPADKTKLTGLSNYTHPANHPPSIITQDASNRFVTDAEKTTWNAKQVSGSYEPSFSKNTGFNKNFGTAVGTVAQGNDSRILNGQTAFSWGNHAGLYPSLIGTGARGTWGINISGISGNSTLWNGLAWSGLSQPSPIYFLTTGGSSAGYSTLPEVKTALGLGSNAYTSTAYLPLTGGNLTGAIKRSYVTQGTSASPSFEPSFIYGLDTSNLAGMYGGNSFGSDNGTYLKFVVNSSIGPNIPINALIIKPNGSSYFRGNISVDINTGTKIGFNVDDSFTLNGFNTAHYGISSNNALTNISGYGGISMATLGYERIKIMEGGNVGIGTNTPLDLLAIGNQNGANNQFLRINNSTGTPNTSMGGIKFFNTISSGFELARIEYGLGNANVNDGTLKFYVGNSGTFNPALSLAQTGAATFSSSVTASGFFQSSDRRLKTILKRDGDVAYFKWKDGRDSKTHIGYIAQEVRKNNPDQVQKGEDKMLSVNYVEILVEKVRLLEKRIEELEKK